MRTPALGILCLTISLSASLADPKKPDPSAKPPSARPDKAGEADKAAKSARRTPSRQPVTAADYGQWERLSSTALSPDGAWVAYSVNRVDDKRTLHLHRTAKPGKPVASFEQGERPVFSDDSSWLAVTIGKSPAELKKARRSEGGPAPSAGRMAKLRNLKSGETTEFSNVKGMGFSADGKFLALEVLAPAAPRPAGSPKPATPPAKPERTPQNAPQSALVIRHLADGTDMTFGNVARHAWSDQGALLALVIDSPGISNSLQIFDPASGVLRVLESSEQEFVQLAWRRDSFDLAAQREIAHAEKEDVSHVLLAWRDLDQRGSRKLVFEHPKEKRFPTEMYISAGGLSWSDDGQAILCDLRKWEKKPKGLEEKAGEKKKSRKQPEKKERPDTGENTAEKAREKKDQAPAGGKRKPSPGKDQPDPATKPGRGEEGSTKGKAGPASGKATGKKEGDKEAAPGKPLRDTLEAESNVEVWHSRDVRIMPLQKKQADRYRNPKRRSAWRPDEGTFTQLATELTESVQVLRDSAHAIGTDRTAHERQGMFGPDLQDIYLIDTKNGKRQRILEAVKYQLSPSPDGRFVLFLRDGDIWSHELKGGRQRNLTGKLEASFTNQEDDTLATEKRPYSRGDWLADGSAVILASRYDLWMVAPDGKDATRLTDGAGKRVSHRLSRASFHEDDRGLLNPDRPLFLGLFGELSKKSGYARLRLRGKRTGTPEVLLWEDARVQGLQRARDAEVYSFSRESYEDSPDLFLATGEPDLAKARRVSRTNSFQKKFLWGRTELVDFENEQGVPLQGSLTYPADYQPGRRYPMLVYIYEKRSQDLHRYPLPTEKHPYNPAVFSAEGYFVFQPDIVYRPQEPGPSALECVVPAVRKVLESGMIDEKRIGLVGHSWGAYQTAFIVTRSNLFAAGVAGAPLTNMMSMSVSVYWNSGETNAAIFTQSQGRMDKPFWRDVDNYVRNSPIHGLDQLETPLLIAFGDKDGAVDFGQGVQMYNAARWAGIDDLVMLVYPGENHSLKKEENVVDYHHRVLEWFGHYLRKQEAPKWITQGKSFVEREAELKARKEEREASRKAGPGKTAGPRARPPANRTATPPARPVPAPKANKEEAPEAKPKVEDEPAGKKRKRGRGKKRAERRKKKAPAASKTP